MARTEVLGGSDPAQVEDELDREILESETVAGASSPDALLSAMTQTLAPQATQTLALEGDGVDNARTQVSSAGSGPEQQDPTKIQVYNSGDRGDRSGDIIVGRYQLVRQLGKGGMGTVYIAQHTTLPKTFAVKVLNARYARRQDIAKRFLQEAKAVSLIDHENVVSVIDFGSEDDGSAFLVMEHLRGESLSSVCKADAPMAWDRVEHIMLQMCRALQAAHDVGIVHRDVKPENVIRVGRHDDPDFIKVLDFGLAKMQVSGGLRLTQTGMVLGTPDYMSPEQARGRPTDHRADIYAAGAMMYELLCGRVPFKAKTFAAMRQKHLLEPPEPPSKWAPEAGISAEMDAVVLRALAKDPAHRFASMRELGEAISAVGTGQAAVQLPEGHTLPLLAERSLLDPGSRPGSRPGRAMPPTLDLERGRRPAPTVPVVGQAAPAARARVEGEGGGNIQQGVLVSLAVLALFGALAGGYAAARAHGWFGGSQDSGPAIAEAAELSKASEASEAAEAPSAEVELRFDTNVPVVVQDEQGVAPFGDEPSHLVSVPRGQDPLRLVLHAEGYRDLHVVVTPDRNQILEAELLPEPKPVLVLQPGDESEAGEPAAEEPGTARKRARPRKGGSVAPEAREGDDAKKQPDFAPGIVDPFEGGK